MSNLLRITFITRKKAIKESNNLSLGSTVKSFVIESGQKMYEKFLSSSSSRQKFVERCHMI